MHVDQKLTKEVGNCKNNANKGSKTASRQITRLVAITYNETRKRAYRR